jgi:sucrose-6-phosphate hydrolase SacC (GH32 family)
MRTNRTTILLCLAVLTAPGVRAADDLVIADFEGPGYGEWQASGTAFGTGPAAGALPGQMAVGDFHGKGLVNSFHGGDNATGTLTSPEFTIRRRFLGFLIGGGGFPGKTCLNLLVDGKPVRTATGTNTQPGGSENLQPVQWDVSELNGKPAVLQIVDHATGGWGHVNVDQIVQTDRKLPGLVMNAEREFKIAKRYLNLPIKNGAPKRQVTTLVDGRVEVVNSIELASGAPDWWAFIDVGAWHGRNVTLRVDQLREDSTALTSIEQSDTLKGAADLYREPLRGQFHFSPRRGWTNDPNGLVFYNGEYHLFFQHNPYGWDWGNMHWGHAVSRDLVHWQELPAALAPDAMGPMFSGGAVVDWANTSGFGKPGQPAQVLFYTAAGNPTVQGLAYSTDGRRFTKYSGNPVLKQITGGNRDPKVLWHEPTKKWVMCLYVELNGVHTIHFLGSPDLKAWTFLSKTDGLYECPEFYELPVDGDPANRKWILTAASGEYFIGSFDGTTFTPETAKLPGPAGNCCYAAQTFSDIPPADGRRIEIGWLRTATPGMPFNQALSIPRELKLITTPAGPRQTRTPVTELAVLRAKSHQSAALTLPPGGANPLAGVKAGLIELRCEFEPGEAAEVVFTLRGATIAYDTGKQELVVNGLRAPAPLRDGKQRLIIYCDRIGLEVFASDGLTYVPVSFHPKADDLALGVQAKGGAAKLSSLDVHELRSAWDPR